MFLGYQDNKIKFYTEQALDTALYNLERVEETSDEYVLVDDEYVLKNSEKDIAYHKEQRKQEILKELDELDLKSIRAIRSNDTEYIAEYEQQAEALREELRTL